MWHGFDVFKSLQSTKEARCVSLKKKENEKTLTSTFLQKKKKNKGQWQMAKDAKWRGCFHNYAERDVLPGFEDLLFKNTK